MIHHDPTRRFVRAIASAALAGGIALGCGGSDDSSAPAEPVEPANAPTTPATAPAEPMAPAPAMPAREVEANTIDGTLPEGYPDDLPTYPGATPGKGIDAVGLGTMLTLTSDDEADDIMAYYRKELPAQGWEVKDGPAGRISASKDGRSVQIDAKSDSGGGSEISVAIFGG